VGEGLEEDFREQKLFSNKEEGEIFFNLEAPRIKGIAEQNRKGTLQIEEGGGIKEITESEAIQNLQEFLDRSSEILQEDKENPESREILGRLNEFRENLRFIGHQEFNQAIDAISERLTRLLHGDTFVFLFLDPTQSRSERWISIQILKRIEEKLAGNFEENSQDLLQRIRLVENPEVLARKIKEEKIKNWKVIIADDFRISGTRTNNSVYHLLSRLRNHFGEQELASRIEIDLVAARSKNPCEIDGFKIPIHSHFLVPTYEKAPFGYASVTGFWRSVDYGFLNLIQEIAERVNSISADPNRVLKDLQSKHGDYDALEPEKRKKLYLEEIKNRRITLPALARILPPYQRDAGKYKDPRLESDWQRLREKFLLTT